MRYSILLALLSCCIARVAAQITVEDADTKLEALWFDRTDDYAAAISSCDSLAEFYLSRELNCKAAQALALKARLYAAITDFISAEENIVSAKRLSNESACDTMTSIMILWASNRLFVYLNDNERANEVAAEAIRLVDRDATDPRVLFKLFMNFNFSGDEWQKGLPYLDTAYQLAVALGDTQSLQTVLVNTGTTYAMHDSFDIAEEYYLSALDLARKTRDPKNMMLLYANLAGLSEDLNTMKNNLDSAIHYAKSLGDISSLQLLIYNQAFYYSEIGDYENAYESMWSSYSLKDSILTIEKYKAITDLQEKYEAEKRTNEIQSLKLENQEAEITALRYKRTRNRVMGGGAVSLLIAGLLGYGFVTIRRSRAIIAKEKERSEKLLLNILPESVADELKAKGYADAKLFEEVTILFSDFKNFTMTSEKFSPTELVEELNIYFDAFDRIMEKYGIEKIKTIGDSYMAAGGLPEQSPYSSHNVVRAALEMQDFVIRRKSETEEGSRIISDMRVGVNTGPVVAGIIGIKKFHYDVWGDTVNTASRLEANGEIGKVNISEQTYNLVKDIPEFSFSHRGKIQAKGKGEIDMWFVSRS